MLNLIPYILKLSISLAVIYLFYQLLLRKLTFYNWNRWYLLLYSAFCFVLPFINVFAFVTAPAPNEPSLIHFIPVINYIPQPTAASTDWKQWVVVIVFAGMSLFFLRMLLQYRSLVKLRIKAKLLYNSSVKLYHIDKPVIPFSFGNAIYVNQHQHSQQELSDIIRHEFIHVKQRHTIDMLWSEILCIVNWYNPFAWLLKKAIRQNLEFIADQQVLETGFDRKQYQYLLLKVIGTPSYSIASKFNFSSLKKRIAMMNKSKSARVNLIRFLFIIPLLAVILLAFRKNQQKQQNKLKAQAMVKKTQPLQEEIVNKPDTVPQKTTTSEKTRAKKERVKPGDIEKIDVRKDQGTITITLKNGEVDVFDVNNEADRKKYTEKYGGELPGKKKGQPGQPAPPRVPATPAPVSPRVAPTKEAPSAPKPAADPATSKEPAAYNGEPLKIISVADWGVVIHSGTTRENIETLKQVLAKQGYTLQVEELTYTGSQLTTFNALITSEDGSKATIRTPDLRKGIVVISGGKDKNGKNSFSIETKAGYSKL
jgi:Antirepressor regulating drug resistance, predicted signal transduction N-terminal membrane component